MKRYVGEIDTWLRKAILVCFLIIIYAGPASAIAVSQIFDDDMFGEASDFELTLWVSVIWMFAIPLWLAFKWWDTNAAGSTLALGIYLMLMIMIWLILRGLSTHLLVLALAAPILIWNESSIEVDVFYYAGVITSVLVYLIIPVAAIAFQLSRSNEWDKLRY